MAICLNELYERKEKEVNFIFIVRDTKKAKEVLYNAEKIVEKSVFLEISDFSELFSSPDKYSEYLSGSKLMVNSSTPKFNDSIIKLAIDFNSNYCDLASDMYNEKTLNSMRFSQLDFNEQMKNKNLFGLINLGISPGITNFIIGEKLDSILCAPEKFNVKEINLYLLENIQSKKIVFAWSPSVALDELKENPKYLKDKKIYTDDPFENSKNYDFPHTFLPTEEYPINQEELFSIHQNYPEIPSIKIFTGGNEVELVKNLFQLNLLSEMDAGCNISGLSVEKIVRNVLPALLTPKKIEEYVRKKIINNAHFSAMADISVEVKNPNGKLRTFITESVGISFHRYLELLDTPYSGSTYISYPAGIGASIIAFYALESWTDSNDKLKGVLATEQLPKILGSKLSKILKNELSYYKIDIISHIHSN
jgi:saccharopine dehydrogenase-like NADP-dependent oxidoreductase